MNLNAPLGIFGGTFDPIHYGHIQPIIDASQKINITKVAMMPCFTPTHKGSASVSSQHRLNMIKLVCDQHPLLYPESRDIDRGTPTYSVDSMQSLRTEHPKTPLCFFIGTDSLLTLTSWYQWQKLLTLCHFVVCFRHGEVPELPTHVVDLLAKTQTDDPRDLHTSLAGRIYLADTQAVNISSTALRIRLNQDQNTSEFIPDSVLAYIRQHKLYQPEANLC
ncbi:nicotinate-nucleotide adenylyltransferase [Paraglaciecola sp.]|uniref:nicotinate-nucleotide adenylyltransferase n=1 Tax=Paraglaciecola sp. TaxID=1920173 RepID=UPI003EF6BCDC